jgi:hypothetical protein
MPVKTKWKLKVKGWGKVIFDDSLSLVAKRDKLIALLRDSDWHIVSGGEDGELEDRIQDWLFADETESELQYGMDRIYDLADDDGVWLDPSI